MIKIVNFIRQTLKKQGFSKLILPLSGGVDSAVCAYLAARAIGVKNLYILQLPCGNQSTRLSDLVVKILKFPAENVRKIDIFPIVDVIQLTPGEKTEQDLLYRGNIAARVRMILAFDAAKRLHALVCGTENRSEQLLGYFTRFGDSACDIAPIQHLYKTQVWRLAESLGLPKEIIEAKPTAGLWPDQTDENELGFTYQEADRILQLYFDEKRKIEDIEQKHGKELTTKVLKKVKANLFKLETPFSISSGI